MSIRNRVAVAVVWILSLVGVAVWAQTPVRSPTFPNGQQPNSPLPPGQSYPDIMTGEDIGFRVTNRGPKGQVTGRLMVKINGQWTDATFDAGIAR